MRGLAAWGNLTLNARVLELLSDIMFAVDEIRDMVTTEQAFPPFEGFDEALARIHVEARDVMGKLAGVAMSYPEERDPELGDVLAETARRLAALEAIRGGELHDALVLVEAYAAPYAVAFFHEIERLEALVARLRSEARKTDENERA